MQLERADTCGWSPGTAVSPGHDSLLLGAAVRIITGHSSGESGGRERRGVRAGDNPGAERTIYLATGERADACGARGADELCIIYPSENGLTIAIRACCRCAVRVKLVHEGRRVVGSELRAVVRKRRGVPGARMLI